MRALKFHCLPFLEFNAYVLISMHTWTQWRRLNVAGGLPPAWWRCSVRSFVTHVDTGICAPAARVHNGSTACAAPPIMKALRDPVL